MSKRLEGKSILVVDDDEDILSSIELAMRMEGAETRTAINGSEAVHIVRHDAVDAVVLDMMLPKASGFHVMEQIMDVEPVPTVVMITANQGKRHQAFAESLGVSAYLIKPVPLERLVDTIIGLIGTEAGEDA